MKPLSYKSMQKKKNPQKHSQILPAVQKNKLHALQMK